MPLPINPKFISGDMTTDAELNAHTGNTQNPHLVTKAQVGLGNVDDVSSTNLRDRSTHTGTQISSTISDFNEAAQDAVGNALADSADIDFQYPDISNQITAELTTTGVVAGTYSLVSVDSKGRVTVGSNTGSITRYSYFLSSNNAVTGVTPTTVTQLTSASLPIGLYKITFIGKASSSGTQVGLGVRVSNGTATVSNVNIAWAISQGANGTSQKYQFDQTSTTDDITSASAPGANTSFVVLGNGFIRVATAGTVVIQLKSETSTGIATLLPDSFVEYQLV